jgi:hypothetical protein
MESSILATFCATIAAHDAPSLAADLLFPDTVPAVRDEEASNVAIASYRCLSLQPIVSNDATLLSYVKKAVSVAGQPLRPTSGKAFLNGGKVPEASDGHVNAEPETVEEREALRKARFAFAEAFSEWTTGKDDGGELEEVLGDGLLLVEEEQDEEDADEFEAGEGADEMKEGERQGGVQEQEDGFSAGLPFGPSPQVLDGREPGLLSGMKRSGKEWRNAAFVAGDGLDSDKRNNEKNVRKKARVDETSAATEEVVALPLVKADANGGCGNVAATGSSYEPSSPGYQSRQPLQQQGEGSARGQDGNGAPSCFHDAATRAFIKTVAEAAAAAASKSVWASFGCSCQHCCGR